MELSKQARMLGGPGIAMVMLFSIGKPAAAGDSHDSIVRTDDQRAVDDCYRLNAVLSLRMRFKHDPRLPKLGVTPDNRIDTSGCDFHPSIEAENLRTMLKDPTAVIQSPGPF
jgi:hypothetical protein